MNDKLKPCPFCGSAGFLYDYHGTDYQVECINNDCPASYMIGATFDSADEAIDVWNTRVKRHRGHWIDAYPDIEPNPMFMYGICSECGCEQSISNKLNYCPDCGAKMNEVSE